MNMCAIPRPRKPSEIASLAQVSTLVADRGDPSSLPDDILVSRTRAGDVGAFEQLLGRHERELFRLAHRFVRDEQEARDVLQDVFVTTWTKLSGFEDRSQIGSWLYRVTVNASLMHLRARSRRARFVDLDGSIALDALSTQRAIQRSAWVCPDQQLESQELRSVIQHAVDALPALLRSVFNLREIRGCSTRQTGCFLGISESAVKARLHRARKALRSEIEKYLVQ